jgi:uncharacterized protein (TIGR02266 family)
MSTMPSVAETMRPLIQRRAFERLDIELSVGVTSEHNFFTGFSANIAEGGIFVATHQVRDVGCLLHLEFSLPGEQAPIAVSAVVRWVKPYHEGSDGSPGLGLEFISIAPEDVQRIQTFIERERAPLFWED